MTYVWNSTDDWGAWFNQNPAGEDRVFNGSLKLPFKTIDYSADLSTPAVIARWRFGQLKSVNDATGNLNHANIPAGINAEISENGLTINSKNAYVVVNENSSFSYPNSSSVLIFSAWIKSTSLDYASGQGYIGIWHTGLSNASIGYSIYVDTNNKIKANIYYSASTTIMVLSPIGGDVTIDNEWHNVMLYVGTSDNRAYLIVDNKGATLSLQRGPTPISGSPQFSIGNSEISPSYGFLGTIDEMCLTSGSALVDSTFATQTRFTGNIFVSPVFDTEENNTVLGSILALFDTPDNSSVSFSFRANNTLFTQINSSLEWSGFTQPGQISTNFEKDISDLGLFIHGRYQQIRVRLLPSDDDLKKSTPSLNYLEVKTSKPLTQLGPTASAFYPGQVLGQVVNFGSTKTISKVSLHLNIISNDVKKFIVGENGSISFQASNFQSSRYEWTFQPIMHWFGASTWETSGTPISNLLQSVSYSSDEVVSLSPYLSYSLYFPEAGVYHLWGYGIVSGNGLYWSLDEDDTNLMNVVIGSGNTVQWTKFGSWYIEDAGLHTFTIYLGDGSQVILDQWYFTTNSELEIDLSIDSNGLQLPIALSSGPFNTVVRLRSLNMGSVDSLSNPQSGATNICSWKNSQNMLSSGVFNYEIVDNNGIGVTFSDGLSLEFWQIGGNKDYHASWNYILTDDSIGNSYNNIDYGQSFS